MFRHAVAAAALQHPDMFISSRLAVVAAFNQQLAEETGAARQPVAPMSNTEWASYIEAEQRREAGAERPRTDGGRAAARATWNDWPAVADLYDEGLDDALDLYGRRLCQFALAQAGRLDDRSLV